MIRKAPRALAHGDVVVSVGDLSFDSTKQYLGATGDAPAWWPLAALAAAGVIVAIFVYGHKTGWS